MDDHKLVLTKPLTPYPYTRLDNACSRKSQRIQGPTEELGVGDLLKGVDPLDPWVAGYAVDIPPAMALWQCISCENIPHDQQQNRISTPTLFYLHNHSI